MKSVANLLLLFSALVLGCSSSRPLEAENRSSGTSKPTEIPIQPPPKALDLSNEPIASIGHGALFDRAGREIKVTPAFAKKAQDFYLTALLQLANQEQRGAYERKRKKLLDERKWDERSTFILKAALSEWLAKEVKPANYSQFSGKLALLKRSFLGQFEPSTSLKQLLTDEGLN